MKINYNKGDIIFRKGDLQNFMYVVEKGCVGIFQDYSEPSERLLEKVEEGRFFGEIAFFSLVARTATAVALEDCVLVRVEEKESDEFLQNNPEKALEIMKHISSRIRDLTEDYMQACQTASEMLESLNTGKEKSQSLLSRIARFARNRNRNAR